MKENVVVCVSNSDYEYENVGLSLTIGLSYDVLMECEEYYGVINDKGEKMVYQKSRFVTLEEFNEWLISLTNTIHLKGCRCKILKKRKNRLCGKRCCK